MATRVLPITSSGGLNTVRDPSFFPASAPMVKHAVQGTSGNWTG